MEPVFSAHVMFLISCKAEIEFRVTTTIIGHRAAARPLSPPHFSSLHRHSSSPITAICSGQGFTIGRPGRAEKERREKASLHVTCIILLLTRAKDSKF